MEVMDIETIRQRVESARTSRRPLAIEGSGSRSFYGRRSTGTRFSLAGYSGIVEYNPTELVISARAGTRLVDIDRELAGHGQMLGFEPPAFGNGSTIGGAVAMGLAGPGRPWRGSVQDFVLGAGILSGHGRAMNFGGKVIKNVAGFDVSRLMVGAMGCLGILLELSMRVIPRPQCERTVCLDFPDADKAVALFNNLSSKPCPVTAAAWLDGVARIRLSGSEAGVRSSIRTVGGEEDGQGNVFWDAIRNQTHGFFDGDRPVYRVCVKPSEPVFPEHRESVLIDWGGAQRWYRGPLDTASVQGALGRRGGHLSLFRHGNRDAEVFPEPDPVVMQLHQSLKDAFDPDRILNPGRLYGGL